MLREETPCDAQAHLRRGVDLGRLVQHREQAVADDGVLHLAELRDAEGHVLAVVRDAEEPAAAALVVVHVLCALGVRPRERVTGMGRTRPAPNDQCALWPAVVDMRTCTLPASPRCAMMPSRSLDGTPSMSNSPAVAGDSGPLGCPAAAPCESTARKPALAGVERAEPLAESDDGCAASSCASCVAGNAAASLAAACASMCMRASPLSVVDWGACATMVTACGACGWPGCGVLCEPTRAFTAAAADRVRAAEVVGASRGRARLTNRPPTRALSLAAPRAPAAGHRGAPGAVRCGVKLTEWVGATAICIAVRGTPRTPVLRSTCRETRPRTRAHH